MNYIINPSWFYWMSVVDVVKTASAIGAVIAFIALIIISIIALLDYSLGRPYGKGDIEYDNAMALIRPVKILAIICVALLVLAAFVPSRSTLIEMQIAKYATYENAEWTVEAVKGAVDYIVQAIKSVNGG